MTKLNKILLAPEGAGEGSGGTAVGGTTEGSGQVFEGEGQQGDPKDGTGAPSGDGGAASSAASGSGQLPTPPAGLTAEDIARAIKDSGLGAQPTAPAAPARQYTEEEFNKAFNVFQLSDDHVKKVLAGGPDALRALQEMRDGITKQAVTMASYLIQQHKEEVNGALTPLQTYHQEQTVKQLYGEFYEEHADLKPYDAIVRAVVDQMKTQGLNFKTKTEAFKELATRVKTTMKSIPGLNGTTSKEGAPGGQPGKMPTLSSGGQGGSGGRSEPPKKSAGHAIFG